MESSDVSGGALGFKTVIGVFGNRPTVRGDSAFDAVVELPREGSTAPVVARAPYGEASHGPAVIFKSDGPITVATQGRRGHGRRTGYVRSSANVVSVGTWIEATPREAAVCMQRLLGIMDPFAALEVSSRCSVTEKGVATGETHIVSGRLVDTDSTGNVRNDRAVPLDPAPNTTYSGRLAHLGGDWKVTFNEQDISADGLGITVTAVHLELLGPIAVGHVYIAQSRCALAA